jgi:hypothetical protein
MSRRPRRGEVYWVNLDPVVGTEIRKTRPAVIVSNDSCNRYGTRVVVLLITSNVTSLYPGGRQCRGPVGLVATQRRSGFTELKSDRVSVTASSPRFGDASGAAVTPDRAMTCGESAVLI